MASFDRKVERNQLRMQKRKGPEFGERAGRKKREKRLGT